MMNLKKLFNIQAKLDERIVQEHGLEGQDLLDKKILALQVELGELANEWRGFKFWSKDQRPRNYAVKHLHTEAEKADFWQCGDRFNCGHKSYDYMRECEKCGWDSFPYKRENPLLEEYVDCLHFILSIGLELGYEHTPTTKWQERSITLQFNSLFHAIAILNESIESGWDELEKQDNFENIVGGFLGLGDMLGFTWEQIEQAYFDKNKINHERQNTGY